MFPLHSQRGPARATLTSMLGIALIAAAMLGLTQPANAAGLGNLDPTHAVSLTVHKYEQLATGTLGTNDGHAIANPNGNPIDGVTFSVQKVTSIDLSTDAGWSKVNTLTAAQVIADPATYPLSATTTGVTANGGTATFANLAGGVGVYLVRETASPSNVAAPAVPFLVTLPLPDGSGAWNYDVNVYPKNALNVITKTVNDSSAHKLGDTVTWTITTNVPRLPQGTTYTNYAIQDTLDSRLTYASANLVLQDGATSTPLVAGTDYAVNGNVVFEFLQAGLDKLNAASPAAQVVTAVNTTVTAQGDGTITNTATVFTNVPAGNRGPQTPQCPTCVPGLTSPPVATYWGSIKITKVATFDVTKTLAGAEFDVYATDPSAAGAAPITHLTTGADGTAAQTLKAAASGSVGYWLVETKAPTGYQLSPTPIRVDVVTGDASNPVAVTISDPQIPPSTLPSLPFSGGSGTLMYSVAGALLLAGALGGYLISRRRRARSM